MKIEMTLPTVTSANFRSNSRTNRPTTGQFRPAFERSRSHESELATMPDVRAEVVARGKALVANPNYPSKEQVRKIARVLVASGLGR